MLDMASTGLRRSEILENKPKQKYGLFTKFSLAVVGACEMTKNSHILDKTNISSIVIDNFMEP